MKRARDHIGPLSAEPRLTGRRLRPSALGLFAMFAAVAYGGASMVAFERLARDVRSLLGQPVAGMAAVSTWTNTSGVAARARNIALGLAETQPDAAAVERALDELVKASPTSVALWQGRVGYQQARGAPMERVLASFRMSALTGSHEGLFMARRARFGLEHWSELPERDRRTVVRDLLATAKLPEFRSEGYRNIVAQKSQDERDEIRTAVTTSGLADEQLVQALGL